MSMFQNVIIGQYIPGRSLMHHLDARAKLIAVFLFVFVIFLANSWVSYGTLFAGALFVFSISGIPIRYIWKGMLPISILILFTFLLHAFFTNEGELLYSFGAFTVYSGGLEQGFFISMRLFLLVFITSLLTLTTSPIDLTDALEIMLSPLKKIGVPAHDIALMMSIAIRFIPTLLQETEKILKAQAARGADFTKGTVKDRSQAFVSLLVPLFMRAFKRAEDLAYAMEARGYNGGEGRTKLRELVWRKRDTAACIIVAAFGILIFAIRG